MISLNGLIALELCKYGATKEIAKRLIDTNRNALIAWLFSKMPRKGQTDASIAEALSDSSRGELSPTYILKLKYRYFPCSPRKVKLINNVLSALSKSYGCDSLWEELILVCPSMCRKVAVIAKLEQGENPRDVAVLIGVSYALAYREKRKIDEKNAQPLKLKTI